MAGRPLRRDPSLATRCTVLNRRGEHCRTSPSIGWTRCPHHVWKGAEEFAETLRAGGAIPDRDLDRHEVLGLGLWTLEQERPA